MIRNLRKKKRETGLEPATNSLEGCDSSQLSYSRTVRRRDYTPFLKVEAMAFIGQTQFSGNQASLTTSLTFSVVTWTRYTPGATIDLASFLPSHSARPATRFPSWTSAPATVKIRYEPSLFVPLTSVIAV